MPQPVVAIVGRPNVGKSTLFNRIIQKRTAIEEKMPGVTRDRIYGRVEWLGTEFLVVDTGGINFGNDIMTELVRKQAWLAIEEANLLIMVVDLKTGITALDREIAEIIRKAGKKTILVANKGESNRDAQDVYDFYALGLGEPIIISAAHGLNIGDLLDRVVSDLPPHAENAVEGIRVAFIGRPNVGKSSLVNYLAGQERVIVSEIPGTTRDSVDIIVKIMDNDYILVDTAGLRRKSKVNTPVEYYSILRSLRAIEECDVAIAVIDAVEGITEQDKKIIGNADAAGKALILAINKWDLVEEKEEYVKDFKQNLGAELAFARYAPVVYISAKTGKRVKQMFDLVREVYAENRKRISTGQLNTFMQEMIYITPPPSVKGKRLKIYYVTQVKTAPPTFNFFINQRELLHFSYKRFLENQLRSTFGFAGTPIKFLFSTKKEREDDL